MATLDEQIKAKTQLEGKPIKPIEPIGLTRRKQINELRDSDHAYYAELSKYEIDMRYFMHPNYDELEIEYRSKERSYSMGYFLDQYEKIKRLEKRKLMSYDFLKKELTIIFKDIAFCDYKPSEESEKFFDLLINYFFKTDKRTDPTKNDLFVKEIQLGVDKKVPIPIHINKGLMIIGLTGIAKSTILECINTFQSDPYRLIKDAEGQTYELMNFRNEYINLPMVSARELNKISEKQPERYSKLKQIDNLVIDDLLAEDKSFGQWIASDFIEERYQLKKRTHIVVNYEDCGTIEGVINAIGLRYGKRVDSRQFEMFNIVALKDKDKRLQKYL